MMIEQPRIDSHAHVWDRSCGFVEGARYHPDYEATIAEYLQILDAHRIERAVLVQPSFLGADNTYLLECLEAHPDRLRGIVMLDPQTSASEIVDLAGRGVIGVRYNLLSLDLSRLEEVDYRGLSERLTEADLWIEVQAFGVDWPDVLETLGACRLMVDHFGKPSGRECAGFQAILKRDPSQTCLKLSAPYRQASDDMAPYASQLLGHFGATRCLWGSDWPWTQHEGQHSYEDTMRWNETWATPAQRSAMRDAAPDLLGFPNV